MTCTGLPLLFVFLYGFHRKVQDKGSSAHATATPDTAATPDAVRRYSIIIANDPAAAVTGDSTGADPELDLDTHVGV